MRFVYQKRKLLQVNIKAILIAECFLSMKKPLDQNDQEVIFNILILERGV